MKCRANRERDVAKNEIHIRTKIRHRLRTQAGPAAVVGFKGSQQDARENPPRHFGEPDHRAEFTADDARDQYDRESKQHVVWRESEMHADVLAPIGNDHE